MEVTDYSRLGFIKNSDIHPGSGTDIRLRCTSVKRSSGMMMTQLKRLYT
jgi:hypothetical protein